MAAGKVDKGKQRAVTPPEEDASQPLKAPRARREGAMNEVIYSQNVDTSSDTMKSKEGSFLTCTQVCGKP